MGTDSHEDEGVPGNRIKDKSIDELIKAITDSKGQYGFLIGAGTSKPAGILTSGELIDDWQSEAYDFWSPKQEKEAWIEEQEEKIGPDQNRYGFWFEQVYTTKEQRREYIENEVIDGAEPEFGHIVLASMMSEDHGERYVPFTLTPNFDDLLYDAFYHFIEERPKLVNHNALALEFSLTEDTPTIVKVHGDYLYQNVKNLGNETKNLEEDIKDRIVQAIGEFGLVVVGYAGHDDSIMKPLIEATRSGEGVFWCVREEDELSEYAETLLRQPNTFRVEIEGSEELFSKFFARIDGLQTPTGDKILDRAEERAEALSNKRDEAQIHAPEEDQTEFAVADAFDESVSYRRNGEYEKARDQLEEIVEKEPDEGDISYQFARVRNSLGHLLKEVFGEFEEAREHFERAIEIDPEFASAHNNLGVLIEEEFGEIENSRKHYEQAIENNPEHAPSHNNLAHLLVWKFEEFEEAREHFERAIESDPEHAPSHTNLARLLEEEFEEFEEAREHYERAIESDPEYAPAHSNLARLLGDEFEEFEEARERFKRAIEIDPEYGSAHHNLAHLLAWKFEEFEEAREHFERAIEVEPDRTQPHANLARLLEEEFEEFEEAREHFERAIEIDPEHATTHNNLARLLEEEFEEFEEAREHFERAIEIDPEYATAHNNLARLLEEEFEEFEEAREHFERAAELDPEYASQVSEEDNNTEDSA
ncbi:tetratricopeptide repeat protein [Natrinema sp. CGMCC1.2065]|uniref:tetratricopeptide repeat protein n=1 Tax=Natrinema sp. CGMCC1.2065 TaxID=3445767 RepID=UPI003F4A13ED